jgi:hypothetical protein
LALGPVLHIGGQTRFAGEVPVLPEGGGIGPIPMPYTLLSRIVPLLKISRSVSRFDVVVTLCLGVLAAIGLAWLLSRMCASRHVFAAGLVAVAVLSIIGLEYLAAPYPVSFPETRPFHYQLAREPDEFAVMDIPMDWDRPANLLYQTVHRKPLVSGYTSRANPLSPAWRTPVLQTFRYMAPDINSGDPQALAATVLTDLNVRYVIVHKNDLPPGEYRQQTLALVGEVFGQWQVLVNDDWLKVFRVPHEPGKRLPYLVLGDGWGERQWDGGRPARVITASQATVLAHLPEAQTAYLEIEASSTNEPAALEMQAGDQPVQGWPLDVMVPTLIRAPWPLPPGETLIQLRPHPPSAPVTVTRISLVPVP